jgi:hypothetical protein
MSDPPIAVVVRVSEELFPDNDDICLTAGRFVCSRLESHLTQHGHNIAEWIRDGCEEDWGVYFESEHNGQIFDYSICFFPAPAGETQCNMAVQYHVKVPWLQRLFKKPSPLVDGHRLHQTMQEFGEKFSSSRMLTQSQFDAEY